MLLCFGVSVTLSFTNYHNNVLAYENFNDYDEYGCINHQHDMEAFKFGFPTFDNNGCGSIAVFNVLTLANKQVPLPDIIRHMDIYGQNAFGFLGTNPFAMLVFLNTHGVNASMHYDTEKFDQLANQSDAAIYGYLSFEGGHYVTMHAINETQYQMHNSYKIDTMENVLNDTADYFIKFLITITF